MHNLQINRGHDFGFIIENHITDKPTDMNQLGVMADKIEIYREYFFSKN
ncbi:MAG: hypothetical protein FWE58_02720 [Methanobrevibacter sp.]|nr:hypothetical protein [Methanobrevibacter sp.]